ncbi:MAG: DNA polymerase/3'-5' exonuclease PolX [Candidatus Pacebacteria bacterium]|nr:DNA polymerase/3'-5' exonuclease PolX [Candidatus Paceibacterota bacterium]
MKNQEIARILFEIGDMLEIGDIPFKPKAYQQAAIVLDNLEEEVEEIYKREGIKGLENIPAVGKSIAEKIEEFLKTGKIKYYEQLKKKSPLDVESLNKVEGLGPQKIKKLYRELDVRNLSDLEKAAKAHKVAPIFGFGKKTEDNILEAIEFLRQSKGRFLLRLIFPEVQEIEQRIKKMAGVKKVSVAGSTRRRKETIGDVDFLVAVADAADKKAIDKIMSAFTEMENVVKVVNKGETKSSVKTKEGLDMDLRVVPESSFGAALQYFTGSKEHNVATRRIAIKKGLKLNEYGLFTRAGKKVRGETEEGIYEYLGMGWMPPEIREDQGEIEAAIKKQLPELIEQKDIKGDFHCHSSWDGGEDSLRELGERAIEVGYEYLGITDHTKTLKIENGLDEKELIRQRKEIDKLNKEWKTQGKKFRLLQGAEVEIHKDGSLDFKDEVLKQLDFVSVSVHSNFKMGKTEMTKRIVKAISNPYVDILNHPTGQILGQRDSYEVDMDEVMATAKKYGVALEINSYRADVGSQSARRAKEMGIKMTISSDAHFKKELNDLQFGVFQARRGWLTKKDVINAQPLEKLGLKKTLSY